MASILEDEGYGQFEKCFNVVKSVRGDISLARKYLSKLIFREFDESVHGIFENN